MGVKGKCRYGLQGCFQGKQIPWRLEKKKEPPDEGKLYPLHQIILSKAPQLCGITEHSSDYGVEDLDLVHETFDVISHTVPVLP